MQARLRNWKESIFNDSCCTVQEIMTTKRKKNVDTETPVKKERKSIDLVRKLNVIKLYEGGKKVNAIARDMKLSHSTVSTIIKDKERIHEAAKGSAPMQSTVITKQRLGPIHKMEKLLMLWIEDNVQNRTPLSLRLIQAKAKSLFQTLQEKHGQECSIDFQASTGWFRNFKRRFGFRNIRITGEAASADTVERVAESEKMREENKRGNESEKRFTAAGLAEAFVLLQRTMACFENMDQSVDRFSKVQQQLQDATRCYQEIYKEKIKEEQTIFLKTMTASETFLTSVHPNDNVNDLQPSTSCE